MMIDILDGIYTGPLTREQTVEQYIYRGGIHQAYIQIMIDFPNDSWEVYGSEKHHLWAINGYVRGIKHIEDGTPEPVIIYRSLLLEFIKSLFRRE